MKKKQPTGNANASWPVCRCQPFCVCWWKDLNQRKSPISDSMRRWIRSPCSHQSSVGSGCRHRTKATSTLSSSRRWKSHGNSSNWILSLNTSYRSRASSGSKKSEIGTAGEESALPRQNDTRSCSPVLYTQNLCSLPFQTVDNYIMLHRSSPAWIWLPDRF